MMIPKQKNKKMKTLALAIVLAIFLSFSPIGAPKSHAWMSMQAATLNAMLIELSDQIKGVMVNVMKQAAAKSLSQGIEALVGGNSAGGALIITDWEDYLVKQPQEKAKSYMNDYLSQITSGRGSSSNYLPSSGGIGSGEGFGGSGNYVASMKQSALNAIDEDQKPKVTFEGEPSQMFAGNDFKQFESYFSGINNPWSFEASAEKEYAEKKADEKMKKQIEGGANQGWESQKSGDQVIMPGSTIKDMYVNVENIPNEILANATRPAEVVASLCSSIINKAITNGIGQVKKYVNQAGSNVEGKINEAVGSDIGQYYNHLNTAR